MPRVPSNGSSGESIVYPIEHMRQTAAKILAKANYAQEQHDTTWGQIQSYVQNNFEPDMQGPVMNLLHPYAARLRAAYDWQISLASSLFAAVDLMETTDGDVAQAFTPVYGFGRDTRPQ